MDVSYFLESAFSRASVSSCLLRKQAAWTGESGATGGPESPGTEEHVQTCLKHSWLLFTVWGRSVKYKARSPQMARQRLHSGPPDFGNYGGQKFWTFNWISWSFTVFLTDSDPLMSHYSTVIMLETNNYTSCLLTVKQTLFSDYRTVCASAAPSVASLLCYSSSPQAAVTKENWCYSWNSPGLDVKLNLWLTKRFRDKQVESRGVSSQRLSWPGPVRVKPASLRSELKHRWAHVLL